MKLALAFLAVSLAILHLAKGAPGQPLVAEKAEVERAKPLNDSPDLGSRRYKRFDFGSAMNLGSAVGSVFKITKQRRQHKAIKEESAKLLNQIFENTVCEQTNFQRQECENYLNRIGAKGLVTDCFGAVDTSGIQDCAQKYILKVMGVNDYVNPPVDNQNDPTKLLSNLGSLVGL